MKQSFWFSGDLYVVLVRAGIEAPAFIAVTTLAVFYTAWFGAMLWLRRADPRLGKRRT